MGFRGPLDVLENRKPLASAGNRTSNPRLSNMQSRHYTHQATPANGPGSVVGIATGYGLDGPGIESRWGARFSAHIQTGPRAHPPPVQWVLGFSRGKERPGRDADLSAPSSAVVMKG